MNNKKIIIIVSLALVFLLVGAYLLYDKLSDRIQTDNLYLQNEQVQTESNSSNESAQSKTAAPDFTVYDRNGNAVSLSDFKGKPVIVNFWASWCGPCKSEMPDFDEAYNEYGQDIHFLMVNLTDGYRETKEIAVEFIDQSGYSFPVYFDEDVDAANTYSVYSIPATYFIDAEGYLVAKANGAINGETLKKGIDMILI